MLAVIRRKLARAEGIRAFNRNNPSTDPGLVLLAGQLDERYERATAMIQIRGELTKEGRAGTVRRGQVRRRLRQGLLRLLSRAGLAAAKDDPELQKVFRPIRPRVTSLDFAASARSLIEAGREHLETLTRYGVTAERVEEASSLLDDYVAISEQSLEARTGRIKAGATLREVASEIMDIIARIDGLNQHRFADDPELLTAWTSAKDVAGPLQPRSSTPASEGNGTDPLPTDAPSAVTGGDGGVGP